MKLKFLGTGTSQGVPPIGCRHPVCLSQDPRDRRLRSSALITMADGTKILIDCGPDFRQQMLSNGEDTVDAVLITHEHNDHVIGLDDMRPIIFQQEKKMPVYCAPRVAKEIASRFPYAFAEEKYPGAPSFEMHEITERFDINGHIFEPIEVWHNKIKIYGYKTRNSAYITDASRIDDKEIQKLKKLDTLVINCLRSENPHPAHFILPEIIELTQQIQPKRTFLTHISHHLGFYRDLERSLPSGILPAYDGLEINF